MTTAPGADELRARRLLIDAINRTHTAPDPEPAGERPRDWFDEYVDATTQPKAPPPGPPPDRTTAQAADEPEPNWDFRRLLHWPYARLTIGAVAALIPWYAGYSAATKWGAILSQARAEAGTGAAYVIAGVVLGVTAVLVHRRRAWWAWVLLAIAFVGTIAMARPYDIVQFVTGVTR